MLIIKYINIIIRLVLPHFVSLYVRTVIYYPLSALTCTNVNHASVSSGKSPPSPSLLNKVRRVLRWHYKYIFNLWHSWVIAVIQPRLPWFRSQASLKPHFIWSPLSLLPDTNTPLYCIYIYILIPATYMYSEPHQDKKAKVLFMHPDGSTRPYGCVLYTGKSKIYII